MSDHFDSLETRDPAAREVDLFTRLPANIAHAMTAKADGRLDVLRENPDDACFSALQEFRIEIWKRRNVGMIGLGHNCSRKERV